MSYNSITVIGNVGADAEMRHIQDGTPVTNFSLAVNFRRSGSGAGAGAERDEDTQWFRIACWNKLAETVNEYVRKGSRVLVEGRFRSRQYTKSDGTEGHANEIIANRVLFLSRPGGGGGPADGQGADIAEPTDYPGAGDNIEDIPF